MTPTTDQERRALGQFLCIAIVVLCAVPIVLMVVGALALPGRW
jgi:hypothetical protein